MSSGDEDIDVYITKYALTNGIEKKHAIVCHGISSQMITVKPRLGVAEHYHGEGRD